MSGANYADLIVWQKAMDFVEMVYRATARFPKEEIYGLTSQVRRAAVSIASNIAEGQGRGSQREFARFLSVAYGSLREVETQVLIAERLRFLDSGARVHLMTAAAEIGRLLNGLTRAVAARKDQS
jgi:four helix bundle protein